MGLIKKHIKLLLEMISLLGRAFLACMAMYYGINGSIQVAVSLIAILAGLTVIDKFSSFLDKLEKELG